MKNISIAVLSLALIATVFSCSKQTNTTTAPAITQPTGKLNASSIKRDAAHPHDISVPDANPLILSYLATVPDSATKDMTMDANEMRDYLNANPSITTLHYKLAHDVNYATEHYGQPSNGMHLTLVVFGTTDANTLVLNARNALFEHMGDLCNSCKCCASYLNPDGSLKYSVN